MILKNLHSGFQKKVKPPSPRPHPPRILFLPVCSQYVFYTSIWTFIYIMYSIKPPPRFDPISRASRFTANILLQYILVCLYVWMDAYIHRYIHRYKPHGHRGLNSFWPHKFGLKPLLGFEHMAPIRPRFPSSHDNHSATEKIFLKFHL